MSVLFIATVDNGTLPKASLEALTAATSLATGLGTGLIVGLVGAEVSAAANAIAGCGAEKMLGVAGA
ncbi:MAG: electron transfer flavoprotein subunit alpha, partial [Proteobacteria bacterium]|nr:electron transfer flavoprotein subunit alpha [Pseudomonadota bacterium]MBU1610839.1 electron transfer flavoprotein subunit alpha [Pseudomonadota bacterium]